MAMDRGGTGTSQGSSSNQKGGSGEGSKSSSRGGGSNNRGGWSGGSGSNGGGRSSSSSKGSSSNTSSAGSSSSKASSSSTKPGSVGTGKAGGNLAGGNGLAGNESSTTSSTKQDSAKKGVASRVSSVNQTLSSYGAAPSYARAGYGDTLNSQRQQADTSNHNISSIGGPSMYGMNDGSLAGKVAGVVGGGLATNFNETIKTDNVNGVIGNLQRKAKNGTLSEGDRANITDMSGAYGKQAGANIVGGTLLGGVGKAAAGLVGGIGNQDSYFSGVGRDAANGDLDSSRLSGQRGKQLGSEGGLDSALKVGMSLLSGTMPGSGLVLSGVANSLTQPASGFGEELGKLNASAGNSISNESRKLGNGSGGDYIAPPRHILTDAMPGGGSLAFDSSYYDPSRFNVTTGKRGY